MAEFFPSRWIGNDWPSIEIEPLETVVFEKLLAHLAAVYQFPLPSIVGTLDGHAADFNLLGADATLNFDHWSLSFACTSETVRDQVLTELQALPAAYFD